MGLPQSDPHNTIRPPQSVKPRRVSPRSLPECNLVRNPCVRGGSQADLYDDWICSPYLRMLMFVLTTLESYAHSLIQSTTPILLLVEDSSKEKVLDKF